jgi:hypothetical protein
MTKGKAQTKTALGYALAYAKLGVPAIWIPRGEKGPRVKGWPTQATTDASVIKQWADEHPGCNFGLVMGNGYIAVDVDSYDKIDELAKQGVLPDTRMHVTGSYGLHLIYRVDPKLKIKNAGKTKLPGCDIRSDGGQIVCPGSVHPNGNIYEIAEESPIVDAPPELIEMLVGKPLSKGLQERLSAKATQAASATKPSGFQWPKHKIREGEVTKGSTTPGRKHLFFRYASKLRSEGLDGQQIYDALVEENPKRCAEPLPDEDLQRIAHKAAEFEPGIAKHTPAQDAPNNEADETEEWEPPLPLPGKPPVAPFTEDMLPGVFRAWCADVAKRMQCPLDFPAVGAVSALGAAVGRRVQVQPKALDTGWVETANLWGGIVAPPGAMKSPATATMFAALRSIEDRYAKQYAQDVAEFKSAEVHQKSLIKLHQSQSNDAVKKGEKFLAERPDDIAEPVRRHVLLGDATPEAVVKAMSENPHGFMVHIDELAGFLAGLELANRALARALYLSGWNGNNSHSYNTLNRGAVFIEATCFSVFGTIQPRKLAEYLNLQKNGISVDGLLQRFQLLVEPDIPDTFEYTDTAPDLEAIKKAMAIYESLSRFSNVTPWVVTFEQKKAQPRFVEWLKELMARLHPSSGLSDIMREHLSKFRKLVPALALLFEIVECEGARVPSSVSLKSLELALRWAVYLESHAERIYAGRLSPAQQAAPLLARKLLAGEWDVFTVRDVQRKQWSGLKRREDIITACHVLAELGWIRRRRNQQATGRPSEAYEISPYLADMNDSSVSFVSPSVGGGFPAEGGYSEERNYVIEQQLVHGSSRDKTIKLTNYPPRTDKLTKLTKANVHSSAKFARSKKARHSTITTKATKRR